MAVKHLRCPDLGDEGLKLYYFSCYRRIENIPSSRLKNRPHDAFGIELKAAHHLKNLKDSLSYRTVENVDKVFMRPAVEPLLYKYGKYFDIGNLNSKFLNTMVSVYSGSLSTVRTDHAKSWKDKLGNYVQFPDPDYASGYLDRLKQAHAQLSCPIQTSAFIFAETILSHPYPDGNGRLGRMLSAMHLAQNFGQHLIALPIGVIIAANDDIYISNLQKLSDSGNWRAFFEFFDWVLNESIDLLDAMGDFCEPSR